MPRQSSNSRVCPSFAALVQVRDTHALDQHQPALHLEHSQLSELFTISTKRFANFAYLFPSQPGGSLSLVQPGPQSLDQRLALLKLVHGCLHRLDKVRSFGGLLPGRRHGHATAKWVKRRTRGTRLMRWHVAALPDRWLSASRLLQSFADLSSSLIQSNLCKHHWQCSTSTGLFVPFAVPRIIVIMA